MICRGGIAGWPNPTPPVWEEGENAKCVILDKGDEYLQEIQHTQIFDYCFENYYRFFTTTQCSKGIFFLPHKSTFLEEWVLLFTISIPSFDVSILLNQQINMNSEIFSPHLQQRVNFYFLNQFIPIIFGLFRRSWIQYMMHILFYLFRMVNEWCKVLTLTLILFLLNAKESVI
jgi:hypothetical protein